MLNLVFGALAPHLDEQLRGQGIAISPGWIGKYQGHADAIVRLAVAGLITDSEKRRARQRLMKKIVKSLESE